MKTMDKITAFVGQVPQKFYQKKIPKLPLVLVAIIAGSIGTYALINSLAVTTNGCTNVLNAGGNIQSFMDSLQPGDTGCVHAGSYGARGTITSFTSTGTSSSPVTIKNYPGDAKPTILGQFRVTGSYQTVLGFVFDGPTGVLPSGNQDVQVWLNGSSNTIFSDNEVRNNDWHAGIFVSRVTNAQILRSYIHDNGQFTDPTMANLDHGIYWYDGSGLIANNIIEHNYAYGIQLYSAPNNVRVLNNTIVGQTGRGGIIIGSAAANSVIANNIISGNGFGINVYSVTGTNNIADTNLFWNNSGGNITGGTGLTITNSISGNPLFVGTGDYHLTSSSPAINKANSSYIVSPDFDGVVRPQGGGNDIGAYEFIANTPPADTTVPTVSLTAPAQGTTVSGQVPLAATASDNVGVSKVEFYADGNLITTDTTAPYTAIWDASSAVAGTHTITAKAYDAANNIGTASSTVSIQASSANGCTSVLNTGGSLQTFVNSLKPGNIGCVRTGTYGARGTITNFASIGTSSSPVILKNYPGDTKPTILGQFRETGSYQTVSGFVFDGPTGQVTTNPEDVVVWLYGANNATFSDNEVRNGLYHAGIFVSLVTNAKVLRNYVHDNGDFSDPTQANYDHGIYWANGSGVIANNIIKHNYAYGVHLYPSPDHVLVENNTITNQTGRGGIIVANGSSNTVIANNILSDNLYGIKVYSLTGTNNIADTNLFWNNSGGNIVDNIGLTVTNSISGNPLFAGTNDYHLTSGSPAINKANSNYVVSPDYTGIIRPQGGGSDIGAYEFTGTSTPPADTTAPTASFTSPTSGSTVSGIVTATANASDNVGVTKVDLSLDGNLKMTDTTSPYNYSFDSKTLTNGSHTITAKAYDAAGNASTATDTVNISNSDTTPPNAPTGLSATATNATTINLSWTASADTGTNPTGVVKYNVLRNGVVIAQPTTTTYSDTNRTANTTYSYTVQAVDGANNTSANSNTATATTPAVADTTPPTIPTNLQATAANANQVNVTWSASADTGGSGVAGYNIYRNGIKLNSSPVTTTSYGDGTVSSATTYSYTVQAVDGAGNKTAQTAPVSVTTPAVPDTTPPSMPTNLRVTSLKAHSVSLAWNASTDNVGIASYRVWRDDSRSSWTMVGQVPGSSLNFTDNSVSSHRTYYYAIRSVDAAGNVSASSQSIQIKTPKR
jgi:type III secretion system FlhB-like substrate exporter